MIRHFSITALLCFPLSLALSSDVAWQTDDLVGHTFELVSDTRIMVFTFNGDGYVSASVGTKNIPGQPDGAFGPLWEWRIDDGGVLRIFDHEKKDRYVLKKMKVERDKFFVEQAGVVLELIRTRYPSASNQTEPNKPVQINAVDAPRNSVAVTEILRLPRRV